MLKCTRCKEEKPATLEFFPAHKGKDNGFCSWCRKCRATYRSGIRRGNYRHMICDEALTHMINTTPACVICGEETNLVVDHDHATNKIRGMLCNRCNKGLGLFRDDPDLLEYARIYLLSSAGDAEASEYLEKYGDQSAVLEEC